MRKDAITFQIVQETCKALETSGERVSVRKLHAQLGGSFSTLSQLLRQWQQQGNESRFSGAEISEDFKRSLLAEFHRMTNSITDRHQTENDQAEERFTELQGLLTEQEELVKSLRQELNDNQEQTRDKILTLEKALSALEARAEAAEKRELKLQDQLDSWKAQYHEAKVNAEVAEKLLIMFQEQQKSEKNVGVN